MRRHGRLCDDSSLIVRFWNACLLLLLLLFYPWVYSSQGLKQKVKIKAGVAIGPGRRQSWKCREAKQNENAEATPKDVGREMM